MADVPPPPPPPPPPPDDLPAYRSLVLRQERCNADLENAVGAVEDAERDLHADGLGPLLGPLPTELAGRVAALAKGSARAACGLKAPQSKNPAQRQTAQTRQWGWPEFSVTVSAQASRWAK